MRRFVPRRSGPRWRPPEDVENGPAGLAPARGLSTWKLTVRRWPALARTRVVLAGEADERALAALQHEIERARERGDAVSLDLGDLASCPAGLAASYRETRRTAPLPRGVPAESPGTPPAD